MATSKLLKVVNLKKYYSSKRLFRKDFEVKAIDGLSFELKRGEALAIVGESGCGKSTLARVLMQLEAPTEGDIFFSGDSIESISGSELQKKVQMIFQDPYGSLNPRKKVFDSIAEPLRINMDLSEEEIRKKVDAQLLEVGLSPEQGRRYPHMFSGGQRQRIGIARALMMEPEILICDEPTSALDVSVQAQILNLLIKLQDERGLSLIFITHDLNVVRHIAHRVIVMNSGKIVERGSREQVMDQPQHSYTKKLLSSTPQI